MLEIKNLHVTLGDSPILKGINLTIKSGQVHAIMGPNGAGKSTLAAVLAGRDNCLITEGSITFKGSNLLDLSPHERAGVGLFLGFQYPVEIPGVSNMNFLRTSLNAIRKYRGENEVDTALFLKKLRATAELLKIDPEMLKRGVNVGFSGGEKKRNEMLQMIMLEPCFAVLDETDSGLDIDALRIVAKNINKLRTPERSFLVITHYQRLLEHVKPDKIHVMTDGRIVKTGGPELAIELEERGYASFSDQKAA